MTVDREIKFQQLVEEGSLDWERKFDHKKWELRFQAVVDYANTQGHCQLPTDYTVTLSDGSVVNLFKFLSGALTELRYNRLPTSRVSLIHEYLITPGFLDQNEVLPKRRRVQKEFNSDTESIDESMPTSVIGTTIGDLSQPVLTHSNSASNTNQSSGDEIIPSSISPDNSLKSNNVIEIDIPSVKLSWEHKFNLYRSIVQASPDRNYNIDETLTIKAKDTDQCINLGQWLNLQRYFKRKGKLSKHHENKLEELVEHGFLWDVDVPEKSIWDKR